MSAGHDDYAIEPIRGLPEKLPAGEHILWQGAPSWWEMAKHAFHIRGAGIYFAILIAWRVGSHASNGGVQGASLAVLSLLPIALTGLGLLGLLAWLCSQTSVYTITNRRIVMRIGVALPTAINIPFAVIGAAGLRQYKDGAGDIPLTLTGAGRMAYSNLWPHVRPWHLSSPEPMLRGLPKASQVADLLGEALAAAMPAGERVSSVERIAAKNPGIQDKALGGFSIANSRLA
jgi:hypothetical protein